MKIAVTAQGGELTSELDPRFGRAAWFVIVDTDTGELPPTVSAGWETLEQNGEDHHG